MVYEMGNRTVDGAVRRVLDGERLDRTDGLALLAQPVDALAAGADLVRRHFSDGTVDACGIVNAKAGNCAEDCGFCAQSAHFETETDTHGFLDPEDILGAAKRAEADGTQRFGIVVAEKGVSKKRRPEEWADVIEAIRLVREETSIEIDASLGLLTRAEAEELVAEGLNHYNHNVETSRRYFPEIVSTHDFEDRLKTLRRAKRAGMDLCSGVILGMGESPADRIDAAIELQEIGVSSLPVNVLNPVEGTPLGERERAAISTAEIVKTVAVYRFLHPEARVRLTGGREVNLEPDEQHLPFEAGADGILTGDYLTTEGQTPADDLEIIERAGLEPNRSVNAFAPDDVRSRYHGPDGADTGPDGADTGPDGADTGPEPTATVGESTGGSGG
jgi:biotin synthase